MYTRAVKKEIDFYSGLFGDKPVTSFYIGGGTPTTMLYSGLDNILEYIFKRRKTLHILEDIFYDKKFERTSVWAFTKEGNLKYCSVTVPLYVGLGASGGSYLKDIFYLNTFNVAEYIKRLEDGRMPICFIIRFVRKHADGMVALLESL